MFAAPKAVFATEIVVETDHYFFVFSWTLFLSEVVVGLQIKTSTSIISLLNYIFIDKSRYSSTDPRRPLELNEDVFAATRLEQINEHTALDNVSSDVSFLVHHNGHVPRFIFLHLGF